MESTLAFRVLKVWIDTLPQQADDASLIACAISTRAGGEASRTDDGSAEERVELLRLLPTAAGTEVLEGIECAYHGRSEAPRGEAASRSYAEDANSTQRAFTRNGRGGGRPCAAVQFPWAI